MEHQSLREDDSVNSHSKTSKGLLGKRQTRENVEDSIEEKTEDVAARIVEVTQKLQNDFRVINSKFG